MIGMKIDNGEGVRRFLRSIPIEKNNEFEAESHLQVGSQEVRQKSIFQSATSITE